MTKRAQPCGSWISPLTASLAAGKTLSLSAVSVSGDTVFWQERRPADNGRTAIVCARPGETPHDVTPAGTDVSTRVHEYGGKAFTVSGDQLVFSSHRDSSVSLISLTEPPDTPPLCIAGGDGLRYAGMIIDPHDRGVIAVREDHRHDGEPENTLVTLSTRPGNTGGRGEVLISGADFYSSPVISPNGAWLAWIEWSHPEMPWTSTRLCTAPLSYDNGRLTAGDKRIIAGIGTRESITEPQWRDDHTLIAVSDRSGWWNLWEFSLSPAGTPPVPLCPMEAETGQPHWVFGQSSYSLLPDGQILVLAVRDGQTRTCLLTPGEAGYIATPTDLGLPAQCPAPLHSAGQQQFAWLNEPASAPAAVVTGTPGQPPHILRAATTLPFGAEDIALPEIIHFPLPDGATGSAFFYAPRNSHYSVPDGERPPLIVTAHGGPTARANESFSAKVQWWTTRGLAVLSVNYSGSTGFGRAWRERLDGQWGTRDVEDCIAATRSMARSGRIDPARIAIRGSSSGGLTVLAALATSDLFAAGVSLYGVTDLRSLARDTHKFESRYLDSLIGPWPAAEQTYIDRSPLFMADRIRVPVLFLQGLDDRIVLPDQSRDMVAALRKSGVPCALKEFPGEGHGFRRQQTVETALLSELNFYGQIFGFTPADQDTTPGAQVVLK